MNSKNPRAGDGILRIFPFSILLSEAFSANSILIAAIYLAASEVVPFDISNADHDSSNIELLIFSSSYVNQQNFWYVYSDAPTVFLGPYCTPYKEQRSESTTIYDSDCLSVAQGNFDKE